MKFLTKRNLLAGAAALVIAGGSAAGVFKHCFVGLYMDIPGMPALAKIRAMVEGNPVQPRPDLRIPPEPPEIAVGLDEDVMSGVLGLGLVAEQTQRQIKHLAIVRFINGGEFGLQFRKRWCGGWCGGFCGRFHVELQIGRAHV